MNSIIELLTTKTGWVTILTGLTVFLSYIVPVIPDPWKSLAVAILGVLSFYNVGKVLGVARQAGVKGL